MKDLIIDESVSQKQLKIVLNYLKSKKISLSEIIDIKETFPGIPDNEIIKHLLNENSIFITNDRVAHNKVLFHKKKSIYIDIDFIIKESRLKGIKLPQKNINNKNTELSDNYLIEKTDIHEKVIPESEKQLKKLKTKRRRIRNYFEGLDNINNIDISLSQKQGREKTLIGLKIRAISNNGIKSLDASEIYIIENQYKDQRVLLCYVLIALLRLNLNSKTTTIYYDQTQISGDFNSELKTEFAKLYETLKSYFDQLIINSVKKGKNIEMLRRKLNQLIKNDAGKEIVVGDIEKIRGRMME